MRSNDFRCVGYIDTRRAPEFELIDVEKSQPCAFKLITEDNCRFVCQTDDRQIAFRNLQRIDTARLYRCKGHFQPIDGQPVFFVYDF